MTKSKAKAEPKTAEKPARKKGWGDRPDDGRTPEDARILVSTLVPLEGGDAA